mmetsp:Transcript_98438/g.195226  ORF Transcript_98438/g.195226 Transcript_98438/m.195226 type:complete len:218 (-) Transcript_98438:178-831(-)
MEVTAKAPLAPFCHQFSSSAASIGEELFSFSASIGAEPFSFAALVVAMSLASSLESLFSSTASTTVVAVSPASSLESLFSSYTTVVSMSSASSLESPFAFSSSFKSWSSSLALPLEGSPPSAAHSTSSGQGGSCGSVCEMSFSTGSSTSTEGSGSGCSGAGRHFRMPAVHNKTPCKAHTMQCLPATRVRSTHDSSLFFSASGPLHGGSSSAITVTPS